MLSFVVVGLIQIAGFYACLAGIALLYQKRVDDPVLSMAASLATVAGVALAGFWIAYLLLPHRNAAFVVLFILQAALAVLAVRGLWTRGIRNELSLACALCAVLSVALLIWAFHGWDGEAPLLRVAADRWTHPLPGDNSIPFDFARGLHSGAIPSPLHADWLSSDRPPLQTALYLLTPGYLFAFGEKSYQAAATAFQMSAFLAVFWLLRSLGVSLRLTILGVTAVFFSPFAIVHTTYVWPKMLAAAFSLAAFTLYFAGPYPRIRRSASWGAVLGLLVALSMLAHGGAVFVLVGMAAAALFSGRLASVKFLVAALVAAAVLYAPWVAYQRYADPPGNRLVKWHIAGVSGIDSRSVGEAARDSYATLSWDDVLEQRLSDVRVIFGSIPETARATAGALVSLANGDNAKAATNLLSLRMRQFFGLAIAMGPLGLAIFLLPFAFFLQKLRGLALTVGLSLAIWIALLFGVTQTVVHQGSLALPLLIATAAIVALSAWPVIAGVLLALQILVTVFQYSF